MPYPVLAGAEPVSHAAGGPIGILIVHGFTGNPSSMRGVAEAMMQAGFDVEMPRLPGHGTHIDDMLTTTWADWRSEVAAARAALHGRVDTIVAVGQSAGGTLVLDAAITDPSFAGVVCINPVTRTRTVDEMEMIADFLEDGFAVVPGEGSDIADPDSFDIAYDGTPLAPLRSLLVDGVGPLTDRFGEVAAPLRLFTSHQDHVVTPDDSRHLAATWGGSVEHTWLDRSFHVATLDYERDLVIGESVTFAERFAACT